LIWWWSTNRSCWWWSTNRSCRWRCRNRSTISIKLNQYRSIHHHRHITIWQRVIDNCTTLVKTFFTCFRNEHDRHSTLGNMKQSPRLSIRSTFSWFHSFSSKKNESIPWYVLRSATALNLFLATQTSTDIIYIHPTFENRRFGWQKGPKLNGKQSMCFLWEHVILFRNTIFFGKILPFPVVGLFL